MPGLFPDYSAPIVRNAPDGMQELVLARWGRRTHPNLEARLSPTFATPKSLHSEFIIAMIQREDFELSNLRTCNFAAQKTSGLKTGSPKIWENIALQRAIWLPRDDAPVQSTSAK